jgi:hypothetical protein
MLDQLRSHDGVGDQAAFLRQSKLHAFPSALGIEIQMAPTGIARYLSVDQRITSTLGNFPGQQ